MRHLQREVHDGFEAISRQLLPAINRIQEALEDIAVRVTRLEHDRDNDRKRLAAIEQELEKRAKRTKRRK
jgi:chaperonin cofactor prefoldin